MPSRNVSLTEELDAAVQARVDSGAYENASEVVRAALRALAQLEREDQAKLERLRGVLKASEATGIDDDFNFDRLRARVRGKR